MTAYLAVAYVAAGVFAVCFTAVMAIDAYPLSQVVYEAGRSRVSRARNAVVWHPLEITRGDTAVRYGRGWPAATVSHGSRGGSN